MTKTCTQCFTDRELTEFFTGKSECRECNKRIVKEWREKYPDRLRTSIYLKKYGITCEQYEEMLKSQNYVCASCKKPEATVTAKAEGVLRRLAVDHEHSTGEIRGLLCRSCNTSLGLMKDSIDRILMLIEYLESYDT